MIYKLESTVNGKIFRVETCDAKNVRAATRMLAPEIPEFNFNNGTAITMIGGTIHSVRPMFV